MNRRLIRCLITICILLFPIIAVVLCACQSHRETKTQTEQKKLRTDDTLAIQLKPDAVKVNKTTGSSYVDSIANRYELSIAQIRNHTSIDSVYYTGMDADAGFTGDTVFNLYKGLKGAIIVYDDRRSCINKFLLVLNSDNKNVANKIIYMDCDHDESADYTVLRYEFLNDSIFETAETYIPAKSNKHETETVKWKISGTGEIDSLH